MPLNFRLLGQPEPLGGPFQSASRRVASIRSKPPSHHVLQRVVVAAQRDREGQNPDRPPESFFGCPRKVACALLGIAAVDDHQFGDEHLVIHAPESSVRPVRA